MSTVIVSARQFGLLSAFVGKTNKREQVNSFAFSSGDFVPNQS